MAVADNEILLTIMLKHQQDKNLGEIGERLAATGYAQKFPPEGIEVASWYVMMGIGQVVDLARARTSFARCELGYRAIGVGAFDTEFYPTYDYMPIWEKNKAARAQSK